MIICAQQMINALSLLTKAFADVIILANKWILIVIPRTKKGGEFMSEIFGNGLDFLMLVVSTGKMLISEVPVLGYMLVGSMSIGLFKFLFKLAKKKLRNI